MNGKTFREQAKAYLDAGFSIIPIKVGDKKPPENFKWTEFQNRQASITEVEAWVKNYGDLNIGIITGQISNIVVIDIDGQDGMKSSENVEIPKETATAMTSNGYHIFCKYPEGLVIRNSVGIRPHIDIRGDGGYVVAAPSLHPSGIEYSWINEKLSDFAPLPEWVIQKSYPNYTTTSSDNQAILTVGSSSSNLVTEGSRNDAMFRIACSLRNRGLSKNTIINAVKTENLTVCNPPLEDWEIDRIIDSAFNYDNIKLFPLTDVGNAERLKDKYDKYLKFVLKQGKWISYEDGRWVVDEGNSISRLCIDTIRDIPNTAPDEEETRKEYRSYALKCESSGKLESMIKVAKGMMTIDKPMLDANSSLLNLHNGTLDLRDMSFKDHDPNDLITKMGEADYVPGAKCPVWDKFLNRIFGGKQDIIDYVQRAVGYSLSGETSEQVFFTLFGAGANGKSTFIDIIKKILGDYGMQTDFSTFLAKQGDGGVRNDIARLCGARLITASESGVGKLLDDTLLKQATGGDKLTARFLYQEHFEYVPTFKIWLITNHKPRIADDSEGMWRRMKLIPFDVVIPVAERDRQLSSKLEAELSGILNWCLDGYLAWRENGLGSSASIDLATSEYRTDMDIFGRFLEDCCDFSDFNSTVASNDLYSHYKMWGEAAGEKVWTQTTFSTKMADKGYKKKRITSGVIWCGVRLRSEF